MPTFHICIKISSGCQSNEILTIPDELKEKYKLTTDVIKLQIVIDFLQAQEKDNLKMASKASKYKVGDKSIQFHFLRIYGDKPEYDATSWLIKAVARWFQLCSIRYPRSSLSRHNKSVYEASIDFLKEVITLFKYLLVGVGTKNSPTPRFKPVQRGDLVN